MEEKKRSVRALQNWDAAEILQSKFKFSMYEALGPELQALSRHGELGRTSFIEVDRQDFQYFEISFQKCWEYVRVRNNQVGCWLW